ncbi:MAG TPA: HAD family phosphatase [Actinomycetota bacterium]
MPTELRACIFDFGGVLTSSIRDSFARFEQRLGLPERAILHAFRGDGADAPEPDFFRLERGEITEGEFYRLMRRRLEEHLDRPVALPEDPAAVRDMMFGSLTRNDEMVAAAHAIAGHYPTGILSNNVKEWTGWRAWVESHRFHAVIDSSDCGMRKPEPGIYALACEQLGVRPQEAAFVDDIPVNVEGAAAVGMHAIRFTTTEEVLAELRPLFPRAFAAEESVGA